MICGFYCSKQAEGDQAGFGLKITAFWLNVDSIHVIFCVFKM